MLLNRIAASLLLGEVILLQIVEDSEYRAGRAAQHPKCQTQENCQGSLEPASLTKPFNAHVENFISQDSSLLIAQCKPDTVHSQILEHSHYR